MMYFRAQQPSVGPICCGRDQVIMPECSRVVAFYARLESFWSCNNCLYCTDTTSVTSLSFLWLHANEKMQNGSENIENGDQEYITNFKLDSIMKPCYFKKSKTPIMYTPLLIFVVALAQIRTNIYLDNKIIISVIL